MGKLHRTNAGYLGVSMEETQDPFWTYNRLAAPLNELSEPKKFSVSTGLEQYYPSAVVKTNNPEDCLVDNNKGVLVNQDGSLYFGFTTNSTTVTVKHMVYDGSGDFNPGIRLSTASNFASHFGPNSTSGSGSLASPMVSTFTGLTSGATYYISTIGQGNPAFVFYITGAASIVSLGAATEFRNHSTAALAYPLVKNNVTVNTSTQKWYGGCASFNGTSSSIEASLGQETGVLTGDFTLEAWFMKTGTAANNHHHLFSNSTNSSNNGFYLTYRDNDNDMQFLLYVGGTAYSAYFTGAVSLNTWYHYAAVRQGNTMMVYRDGMPGTAATTGSGPANISTAALILGRGADGGWSSQYMNGRMQDARLYDGVAKYTSAFAPPRQSLLTQARRYPSGMHVLS